ncbi:MAG TPA: vWA domain-containing protein [Polyangiales bacterium]|nr:vWA domain-containing protein [Polyangiales bacterium]
MSRKSKVEWVAVAFALTAGCSTTNDADGKTDAASSSEVDAGADASARDSGEPDSGDGNPYVLNVPDGGSSVEPEAPNCGARSFEAEQVVTETQVEVSVDITEDVTTEETVEVTEDVTEEVVTTKPAKLYILLDRSASMSGATGGGNIWTPAVNAVKSFVGDEDSAGLGVGIQYFPKSGGKCDGTGYGVPDVAPAPAVLPASASAILTSLSKQSPAPLLPTTGTPIEGALRGATQYCLTYQAAHNDEQCVAVIVTDGKPEWDNCEKNNDKLAAIAKAAKDKGVITFAVGLKGADFGLLNKIAIAGGAPDCDTGSSTYACDVSSSADKLSIALNKIRETTVTTETHTVTYPVTHTVTRPVTHTETRTETHYEVEKTPVPCEWTIPESTDGPFNKDKLNVRWSVDKQDTTLLRVGAQSDCREKGWYYDNPTSPERVIACGQTCDAIKAEEDSKVDILLGCATIVPD